MNENLITRFRPKKFDDVIGHNAVIDSLVTALEKRSSHAFLFSGPAGLGKTTLARLAAAYLGTPRSQLQEVDGANCNSVDDMRELVDKLTYRPLSGKYRSIIIDECHRVSNAAWSILLKPVEEPPEWVFWFFCTTDLSRVPDTIRSRCSRHQLNPLDNTVIRKYLEDICDRAGYDTPDTILQLCTAHAEGSPRKALSFLGVCYDARSRAEAFGLIDAKEAEMGGLGIKLARTLKETKKWPAIQKVLSEIQEAGENPEGIRHTVRAYFTTAAIGSSDEAAARFAMKILDAFSEPYNPAEQLTPLVLSVGIAISG